MQRNAAQSSVLVLRSVKSWKAYGAALLAGVLATGVAVVGHLAFFEPPYADDLLRVLVFVLVAGAISALAAGRRRAENRVREQREEMAVTLASIGDAVIVTDRAGRITFMNTAAERLTGWTADEARGSALPTVFVIVNEETRGLVEIPAARVLLENQVVAVPAGTLLARRGGDERAIDGSVAPIHDRANDSVGVVLVLRDLT